MTQDGTTAAGVAATDLLYHRDAYLRSVEARVVAADAETRTVALDRTIVYPGGGGQPHDTGVLTNAAGGEWPIVAAKKAGDVVWHELGGEDVLLPQRGHQQQDECHQIEDQQPQHGRPEQKPEPAARMGVPGDVAQSTPVCMRRSFNSGWKRMPKPEARRTSPRTGRGIRNCFELLPRSS